MWTSFFSSSHINVKRNDRGFDPSLSHAKQPGDPGSLSIMNSSSLEVFAATNRQEPTCDLLTIGKENTAKGLY
jgi:hypothetical protein